jgi:hypothetical protein
MKPTAISPSPTESARFGLTVGRLVLPDSGAIEDAMSALEESGFDVVILRYPHINATLFADLALLPQYDAIFADCLVYWKRQLTSRPPMPEGVTFRLGEAREAEALVRPIFLDYPSHYTANPLFEPSAALDGYVEWVTKLVAGKQADCLIFENDSAETVGFTIVDVSGSIADIRFGGINPAHRGKGHYDTIIAGSMELAEQRGFTDVKISTQAHNHAVIKTWARQGWTPFESWTTVHMVRAGLLRQQ